MVKPKAIVQGLNIYLVTRNIVKEITGKTFTLLSNM